MTGNVHTCNVTLMCVPATIVAVENKYYISWVCVCSLSCPACNAHALYCRLWSAELYNIFPRYLINGTIFEKKYILNIKCVLIFSTTFVRNIFHYKKNWARYAKKSVYCSPFI